MSLQIVKRKLLTVVMDGVGISANDFGNAVAAANRPNLDWLATHCPWRTINAHGKAVGLPSDSDIGNSEVGHNALGAGRIFDQGAKLVQQAIDSGKIFHGAAWRKAIETVHSQNSTLHFLGLLSDGNVHAHENHLYAMLRQAKQSGVKKVRLHVLLDGRDVGEKSAEIYVERLNAVIGELSGPTFDIQVASGGGRMTITMDRYEADWKMVEHGWHCHVHGIANHKFQSLNAALKKFREDSSLTDQYIPAFVIESDGKPVGKIQNGDAVIFSNFRGDRSIEISRAFTEKNFDKFDRNIAPQVYYAGMMEYDGDLKIPNNFLVEPPAISETLGEHLAKIGVRQFACSETQKFGHVTYFWNGNRSGFFDKSLEEYLEIPSDSNITFDQKPWMKAQEITQETILRMHQPNFQFGRINYANGDMVGHTGDFDAAVIAVGTVDLMLGRLMKAARDTNTILLITADHGNADEMFDAKSKDFPDWKSLPTHKRPTPKTAHTLSPVPLTIYDPQQPDAWKIDASINNASLGNVANTALTLLGIQNREMYLPSLIQGQ